MGKLFLAVCQVLVVGLLLYGLAAFAVPDPLQFVLDNNARVEQLTKR